ncbi:MAG: prohibitin family protein [Bacteroidetes bacterium]|nr:MAG: prohibitin family protein [Bacteroidota bacterium]TAG85207.1 MAG: prohibitin family protein [Bacteroidota bacterium]
MNTLSIFSQKHIFSMRLFFIFLVTISFFLFNSCAIIRPGEVGVKQKLGRIKSGVLKPGVYGINIFTTKMLKVPTRTINLPVTLEKLPSKEGLNVDCELAVLFHIKPENAIQIIEKVGLRFGEGIILSVLRSAAADITSHFFAKDLHTSERTNIEKAIAQKMTEILGDRGFVVESVLLKSIQLPNNLSKAIEEKLEAEQQSQTMKFVLEKQKQEADRQKIEAEGIRDAQKIVSEGLNEMIIKYKSLIVFEKLSTSPNTKVIITDGKTPMLINDGK